MIWNREMECADRETKNAIQLTRLKNAVERCYERVPFYRKKFDEIGLRPEHIRTLEDVRHLPFTTADDLKENYPFGMFAVPKKEVVRLHGSSGTTGKPKIEGYTRQDIENWAEIMARVISAAGGTADDIVQISFGYGLFTGGFGLHYGMEKIGAMVVPLSSGNTDRQIMLMQDLGSTILISTPSYALYLADEMEKKGIDKSTIKLRLALFGGEGHTEEMRAKIEKQLGILATENYGLSEIGGPGYSGECYLKQGLHIAEDQFISEIVDPDTLEPLPMGEKGELVITPLVREAFPVLRYRTRDITWLNDEPCRCGRTSMRMAKVQGRTDDMMVIRGVNVFPSQIESVIMSMKEIEPFYEIIVTTEEYLDRIEVRVEFSDASLLDDYNKLEGLRNRIRHNLKSVLGIDAKVTLVTPGTLPRFEGKAKRVIDRRDHK
ncbi:MAG TPA: phenylacetate--CoA ligase [Candidatus Copromorpha excrementigallinarum]|uniref:Phenylacetate-coenzyme A ligase n=1 Tax=Candidatus Allocopromorpha excrementigallinarum TaxID=2840742 RepID=A0A9D1L6A7_9FIRM|nr:phenylacetate--CoA ligase [Candidatus Copromorpha excrementigallinarum]